MLLLENEIFSRKMSVFFQPYTGPIKLVNLLLMCLYISQPKCGQFGDKNVVKKASLRESIVCPKDAGAQLVPRPPLQMLIVFFCSPQVAGSLLAKPR